MKEKSKNSQNQIRSKENTENNFSKLNQSPVNSLHEFIEQTVKVNFPEINLQDTKTVINTFIEHYSNMEDTVEIVKRLLKMLLSQLNNNPEIGQILNQLRNNQSHDQETNVDPKKDIAINTIAQFMENNKIEGEKFTKFQDTLASMFNLFSNSNINQDTLESVFKMTNIDSDIENSFKRGLLEGRNQKIQEQLSQYATEDGLYSSNSNHKKSSSATDNGYIERLLSGRK